MIREKWADNAGIHIHYLMREGDAAKVPVVFVPGASGTAVSSPSLMLPMSFGIAMLPIITRYCQTLCRNWTSCNEYGRFSRLALYSF